jgi:uncharacterized protein YkwD
MTFLSPFTKYSFLRCLLSVLPVLLVSSAQAQIPTLDTEQTAFLSAINNFRLQNGAGALQVSVALQNSSQWMSTDMATKNYFSHTDSLGRTPAARLPAFGYPYYPWGENIAAGYADAQNTLNQWATACDPDPTGICTYAHRMNMLNRSFLVIGIGRAYSASSTYGWYWTTDFGGVVDQTINPNPGGCSYSISPASASLSAAGGSGSVNVSVTSGCAWSAVSNTGWAQITSGWSGNGSGTVSYSVNPNASVTSQTGTLTIAGQTFTINEAGSAPTISGSASFVKVDTTSKGTWKGVYGADGYNVINDTANYPAYVTVVPSGNLNWTWTGSTTDARGLQKGASNIDRIAACWYNSGSFSIDVRFNDTSAHQVALYLLDWDSYGPRSERVDIVDANNILLDSRTVSGFTTGQYLVWNFSGHVTVRVTNLNGGASNAVVSGILFGAGGTSVPSVGTASFVKTDTSTSGTWKGVYGADGYNVINDTANYPAYVSVTPSGNLNWTWAGSTTDTRGLQKASSITDRIAACWYSPGSFSIDLRFNDTSAHQVALYFVDWDSYGPRLERVDILDGNGTLLDSRTVSGFTNGQYLVWNLSGHVTVRITNLNRASSNAVVSGILFR